MTYRCQRSLVESKSQQFANNLIKVFVVKDRWLKANHNCSSVAVSMQEVVKDRWLKANHNNITSIDKNRKVVKIVG